MNFLDWIKKYQSVIAFLFGIFVGALTMYYGFNSRLDTMDHKLDFIKKEFENVYDVFHSQELKINKIKSIE